jgi:hypothetical protein
MFKYVSCSLKYLVLVVFRSYVEIFTYVRSEEGAYCFHDDRVRCVVVKDEVDVVNDSM